MFYDDAVEILSWPKSSFMFFVRCYGRLKRTSLPTQNKDIREPKNAGQREPRCSKRSPNVLEESGDMRELDTGMKRPRSGQQTDGRDEGEFSAVQLLFPPQQLFFALSHGIPPSTHMIGI